MEDYTVYDGEQPVRFTGTLLSSVTTDDGRKSRWTETSIYKTRAGSYIIHKAGRTRIEKERTLHSAQVSETADGCIECLRFYDQDGVMSMRWTDKRAILEAAALDDDLAAAYRQGINVA